MADDCLAAVTAIISGMVYLASRPVPAKPQSENRGVPVYYKRAEDAMPFSATLDPGNFKNADVKQSYQTAKEIPGVLAQQPCYCYCQRKGHRSLLDCFRTDHAASCNVCIKEALLAGQMRRHGKSPEEIRMAIIDGQWVNIRSSSQ